ncbi:lauroyl-Kdo(2)-lipid IV(A) myristoyltransferase [Vibrio sp. S17_S38]|uniref:lauroyl-Kdo(2)-lipid IV(A) myristoyltransferase n=1 Tax=Vibrio sp. S17_S38 TaxID=2720229 RepID=UPI001680794C|nr:lauroyl-Kdo(2)-lipid IV(A) myristoyltransferase [Vibrio sp. S17_S38]MBD1571836.1 lauroyl-Kdo(2)-lipid IV(A) myristoyltransferase [Vibrio sp. S17_S38]
MSKSETHSSQASPTIDKHLYNPTFEWRFLHPRHWLTWIGLFFAVFLAFIPHRLRDRLAAKLSRLALKREGGPMKKARLNLLNCFPEKTDQERQQLIEDCLATAGQFMFGYPELLLRSRKHNQSRGIVHGGENLFPLLDRGENVIALVPHFWAIDYAAVMIAAQGYQVSSIIKEQREPITNWLIHRQRMQYGGKIYERSAGIKPFLKSVKDGYLGYYLPDEDHGAQNSVFVPFFATQKATLKGFGKVAKLSRATVVPMLPAYNAELGKYELHILPAIENLPSGDEETDARAMNKAVEDLVNIDPKQYMWILNLLRTRPDGSRLY